MPLLSLHYNQSMQKVACTAAPGLLVQLVLLEALHFSHIPPWAYAKLLCTCKHHAALSCFQSRCCALPFSLGLEAFLVLTS